MPTWSLAISQMNFPKIILKFRTANVEGSFALVQLSFVRAPWRDYWIHNEQNRFKALHCARKNLAECVSTYWLTSGSATLSYVRSHPWNLRMSQIQWRETGGGKPLSVVTLSSFFDFMATKLWNWQNIRSYHKAFKLEPHWEKQTHMKYF